MSLAKQTIGMLSLFLVFGPRCILAFKDADIPKLDISSLWQLIRRILIRSTELETL